MNKNSGKSAIIMGAIGSKMLLILGIFIVVFFGIGLIACCTSFNNPANSKSTLMVVSICLLILILLGILFILLGHRESKMIKLFKRYVSVLSSDPQHSIENLAIVANSPANTVKSNIEMMIKKGYFANAHINEASNCVVFGNERPAMQSATIECAAANEAQNVETSYKTVVCKGCGASNKIQVGTVGECEYCGSKLE